MLYCDADVRVGQYCHTATMASHVFAIGAILRVESKVIGNIEAVFKVVI